jgi:hypothetical protein
MTTYPTIAGKVTAQNSAQTLSTRNGNAARVGYAMTAVIPGNGAARATGAVIAYYPSFAAALDAATKVNANAAAGRGDGWSDGRVTVAVAPVATDNGKVDVDLTKVALWLAAENVHKWFAAVDQQTPPQTPRAPRGRRQGRA